MSVAVGGMAHGRRTRHACHCLRGCSPWWACPCAACRGARDAGWDGAVAPLSFNWFLLGVLTSPMRFFTACAHEHTMI
jgi:hypothetical protein